MRGQFEDYVAYFVRFQSILQEEEDDSLVADFGTYMDGYEE